MTLYTTKCSNLPSPDQNEDQNVYSGPEETQHFPALNLTAADHLIDIKYLLTAMYRETRQVLMQR